MSGGQKKSKKKLKRLEIGQSVVAGRIQGCILIRIYLAILVIQLHGISASQVDDTIQISQPKPAVMFQKIGTMHPTLNFGHVRITVNLKELNESSQRICDTASLFEGLMNYSDPNILRNLTLGATAVFTAAETSMPPKESGHKSPSSRS